MTSPDIKTAYKTILDDHFPPRMEVSFVSEEGRQTLFYEKATWRISDEDRGLRYGENPGQEAAMYRLVNGNLTLGDVHCIKPGQYLASNVELLQSGKHPGKTNITDVDSALNILRYLMDEPCAVIVKHNNPCGVAKGKTLEDAFHRANMADRLAAFGGAIAVNRPLDRDTATRIAENYAEVVVAEEFEEGTLEILARRKNLRIMRIGNMTRLRDFVGKSYVEMKSLIDGGVIVQWPFVPKARTVKDFLTAETVRQNQTYRVTRSPTEHEYQDLLFGWLVEAGVTSNSILYVKDGVTVGIGTGEQDRVGVAEIARDKAYRKLADRLAWERFKTPFNAMTDMHAKTTIDEEVRARRGDLPGCCMVSDAFFPFRDGVDVGIREGITAVVQPGGSDRDFEVIEACNEANVAMVFTGQRSFRH